MRPEWKTRNRQIFGKVFSLMFRMIFLVTVFAAVTINAQETPVTTEPEAGQVKETRERPVEQDAVEDAPDIIESTEEFSKDNPEDFPVDI